MNLQSLSKVRDVIDIFDERFYNLKEAIINHVADTTKLETKFRYASTEVILVLNEAVADRNNEALDARRNVYMERLLEIIATCGNIDKEDLIQSARTRKREFVLLRQLHMAFSHKTFNLSLAKAAGFYGQDHATASHSCKVIRNLYQTNGDFRNQYWNVIDHCMSYDMLSGSSKTIEYLNKKDILK